MLQFGGSSIIVAFEKNRNPVRRRSFECEPEADRDICRGWYEFGHRPSRFIDLHQRSCKSFPFLKIPSKNALVRKDWLNSNLANNAHWPAW